MLLTEARFPKLASDLAYICRSLLPAPLFPNGSAAALEYAADREDLDDDEYSMVH